MSDIDRQRISGVKLLESLGYTFRGGEWQRPSAVAEAFTAEKNQLTYCGLFRLDSCNNFRLQMLCLHPKCRFPAVLCRRSLGLHP
jgi:hypothetical protein